METKTIEGIMKISKEMDILSHKISSRAAQLNIDVQLSLNLPSISNNFEKLKIRRNPVNIARRHKEMMK